MARFDKASLIKRAVSGFILAPLTGLVIWFGGWLFVAILALVALLCMREWLQLSLRTPYRIFLSSLGLAYILLCFGCCYLLRSLYGPELALFFIVAIWASDVMAYFTGKFFDGPRLWPAVSPNKTWAGLIGAFIGPLIITLLYLATSDPQIFFTPFISLWTGIALLVGGAGQAGDLIVSALKRRAHMKDAGDLIPGHGGVLDRMDSLLLAAPLFLLAVYFSGGLING